jgi:nitrite reductase/ring-hydroxylating ferredoxin subunit
MSFLYNAWYCAAWSTELREKPIGIRMLNEQIVLYRDSGRRAVALSGRCPHRFAPLSRGTVKGDEIECCYHGLRFNRTGACVFNPHGRNLIPPRARLKAFPIVERHGALWIWMGEADRADPAAVPDFNFVGDPEHWTSVTGYLKINAPYELVIDNLLDLSHGAYLHVNTLGLDPELSTGLTMDHSFETEGTTVHSNYTVRKVPPTPLFKLFYSPPIGDLYAFMRWLPASSLILDISMSLPGEPRGSGVRIPSAHFIAPETEDTCHYFWALSRNVELDDEAKTRAMGETAMFAFEKEDEPVIHACFSMMEGKEFFSLKPAILETDAAAIRARQVLKKLIAEQSQVAVIT